MPIVKCADCRYMIALKCRRYPPVAVMTPRGEIAAARPPVTMDDGYGQGLDRRLAA